MTGDLQTRGCHRLHPNPHTSAEAPADTDLSQTRYWCYDLDPENSVACPGAHPRRAHG